MSPAAPTVTPTMAGTVEPTIMPTATVVADTATPSPYAATDTPVPTPETILTATPWPESAPIYTMSCTFTSLEFNSTGTVITDISGNLTDISSGNSISGVVNSDNYQFLNLRSGDYDLVVDVGYRVDYLNGSSDSRVTRITDNFEVNGNVDKTYLLK